MQDSCPQGRQQRALNQPLQHRLHTKIPRDLFLSNSWKQQAPPPAAANPLHAPTEASTHIKHTVLSLMCCSSEGERQADQIPSCSDLTGPVNILCKDCRTLRGGAALQQLPDLLQTQLAKMDAGNPREIPVDLEYFPSRTQSGRAFQENFSSWRVQGRISANINNQLTSYSQLNQNTLNSNSAH